MTIKKKRILVIDDEELIIRSLANILERMKYEILVAKSSDDGLVIAEEESFDLIICDILMPGMNGIETIKKIRENHKAKGQNETPVIFITGYADQLMEKLAKDLKPKAFFFKPFDLNELLTEIKKAIKR